MLKKLFISPFLTKDILKKPHRVLFSYLRTVIEYFNYKSGPEFSVKFYPRINDRKEFTGTIGGRYTFQDKWAAEKIYSSKIPSHVDIASSEKFVLMCSVFTKITCIDIRPFITKLNNIEVIKGTILSLPYEDNSVDSISSLSVIEHIGLGRYGDPIDCKGTIKAAKELSRVLSIDGCLYVAVPIGKKNIEYFNAHRVFERETFISYFEGLTLVDEAYAFSDKIVNLLEFNKYENPYAYGCYCFKKLEKNR